MSRLVARALRTRTAALALRALGTAAAAALAVLATGWSPAVIGILAGLLVWLIRTSR